MTTTSESIPTVGDPSDHAVVHFPYAPLPNEGGGGGEVEEDEEAPIPSRGGRSIKPLISLTLSLAALMLLALGLVLTGNNGRGAVPALPEYYDGSDDVLTSRGVSEGVSEKSVQKLIGEGKPYGWTKEMLTWQRTAFHFQPEKNWMNGPLFYKGWYHFFYQYNPDSAVWGNITWGHAVSHDLIRWLHLPIAMVPDQWYDINGVWTGSATFLPNGSIVMLYTGSTHHHVQVQNLAFPADPSDPLLIQWTKFAGNPVLLPPSGIGPKDFRDPTTAWLSQDGTWRLAVGSKVGTTGVSLVYKTYDFLSYELIEGVLHAVPETGMWECVDFYPVALTGKTGLDTSASGPGVKHVMKVSLDDDRRDYYAIGKYDLENNTWTPDHAEVDVGIGIRYDYGKFYASKSFYDQNKERRVLWGWIGESDSERADTAKGWASLQGIPRVVYYDEKTGTNLIQWPVDEVETMRTTSKQFENMKLEAGSVTPLDVGTATQLDIIAEFEMPKEVLEEMLLGGAAEVYNCSTSGGAAQRGVMGPFGLLVLADQNLSEQLAVYFYIGKGEDGRLQTFFCQDELKSSKANDLVKGVFGSIVPVISGESLSMRILVDHSIVESFAQGGRTCITSRVYPTEAIYSAARVFLFNNATTTSVTATSITVWQMNSASIHSLNFYVLGFWLLVTVLSF
ncbi:hypothetical protein AAC387_Pa08g1906 [Persea americana]